MSDKSDSETNKIMENPRKRITFYSRDSNGKRKKVSFMARQ